MWFNKSKKNEQELKKSKDEITELKTKILFLEKRKSFPIPLVGVDMEDPTPIQTEARKLYVGQAAGFHKDILSKKIISMVSELRGQFEQLNRDTFGYSPGDYDLWLKGTINGLWLIHQWGEEMINEQISYQTEKEDLSEEDKKLLKNKLEKD